MEVTLIKEPLPIQKDYMKIIRVEPGFYCKSNHVNNKCIGLLYDAFTDHDISAEWLLRTITDFSGRGVRAELVDVSIAGNRVILQPSSIMCEDPEDFAVEFDRNELTSLVYAWHTLALKRVSPIYIFYKDGEYGVSDVLPEGIE